MDPTKAPITTLFMALPYDRRLSTILNSTLNYLHDSAIHSPRKWVNVFLPSFRTTLKCNIHRPHHDACTTESFLITLWYISSTSYAVFNIFRYTFKVLVHDKRNSFFPHPKYPYILNSRQLQIIISVNHIIFRF